MKKVSKFIKCGVLASALLILTGCAASDALIEHGSLQTSTKMSNSIFLPPEATANKLIYVEVRWIASVSRSF